MVQFIRRNAERHANLFVVNATTPAQLFHVLRRQMNRPFQKPLVLFTPKFLLHHRPASSALEDFLPGTFFNRVIDDCKVDIVYTYVDFEVALAPHVQDGARAHRISRY